MPILHTPYWLDRVPKNRRPAYARFRGEAATDVVIVGGGLTGCACALSFATAGIRVLLLEADAIAQGATAAAPGLLREDFDASFQEFATMTAPEFTQYTPTAVPSGNARTRGMTAARCGGTSSSRDSNTRTPAMRRTL